MSIDKNFKPCLTNMALALIALTSRGTDGYAFDELESDLTEEEITYIMDQIKKETDKILNKVAKKSGVEIESLQRCGTTSGLADLLLFE